MPEHIVELNENMKSPIQKKGWPNKISWERGNAKEIYQNRIRKIKKQELHVARKKIQTANKQKSIKEESEKLVAKS